MSTRDYNFINGPQTPTLPSATDPSADEDLVNLAYAKRNWMNILRGDTAPGPSDGANGDYWLDKTHWVIYGPKAAGAWPAGTSLIGADGSGVPPGGTITQILGKASNDDFDTEWVDPPTGGTGGGLTWEEVTGTTCQMEVNKGYIANNAAQVVFTLPPTFAVGDVVAVTGCGAGGWKILQNTGQVIRDATGSSATGTAGYMLSAHSKSCVEMVGTTANTELTVRSKNGHSQVVSQFQGTYRAFCIGGDNGSTRLTRIDSILFSNDNRTTSSNSLSTTRDSGAGVSAPLKAYDMGGRNGSGNLASIEALTFNGASDPTVATLVATLNYTKYSTCGVSGPAKGYFLAGYYQDSVKTIDDMDYSDDSSDQLVAQLANICNTSAPFSSPTKGYRVGGVHNNVQLSSVEWIAYADESIGAVAIGLTTARQGSAGICSAEAGYLVGGYNASPGALDTIEKYVFSNEAHSVLSAKLGLARDATAGSSGELVGYAMAGYNSTARQLVDRFTYAGESMVALGAILADITKYATGVQD